MSIHQLKVDRRVHVPATAVTIGLMLLFPFLVHLIGGPTAGGRWLPLSLLPMPPTQFFAASLNNAWLGLLVLLFIHWALAKGGQRGG